VEPQPQHHTPSKGLAIRRLPERVPGTLAQGSSFQQSLSDAGKDAFDFGLIPPEVVAANAVGMIGGAMHAFLHRSAANAALDVAEEAVPLLVPYDAIMRDQQFLMANADMGDWEDI
jgi:hypothetical protein